MKRPVRLARLILVVGLLTAARWPCVWAESVPRLQGRVNDYAQMLSAPAERQLETMLGDLEGTDGTQIVVLTVTSLEGQPIEEFSIRVAEQWGIGQKQNDNGALLVVARSDRKLRIETGYGLEGRLTDLASGRIIRNVIGPQFKQGRFDQGVIDGVSAMIATVKGEYTAPEKPASGSRGESHGSPGVFGLIVFFFLVNVVGRVNRLVGGVAGAILAPIGGLFFGWGALALLTLIPVGFIAGLIVSLLGPMLSFGHLSQRSRHGHWGGGGGFSSGGGFGGFSGGGGGFGGGGSSGSW
jgi:uncharacterized protein